MWSFSSSVTHAKAAPPPAEPPCGGEDASPGGPRHVGLSWADPLAGLGIKQRLGMGLPLTRLYTQYLGGSLDIMSIPGVGVDTFLQLRRIDDARFQDAE